MNKLCRNCFFCKCKIYVSNYKKHGGDVLYGRLCYTRTEIRCAKGQWFKGDEPYIFKGTLEHFNKYSKFADRSCRLYEN